LGEKYIEIFGQGFYDLASMVIKEGTIEFRGCECGKGDEGQGFLENAAVISNRRIIGYKVLVTVERTAPLEEDTVRVNVHFSHSRCNCGQTVFPLVLVLVLDASRRTRTRTRTRTNAECEKCGLTRLM